MGADIQVERPAVAIKPAAPKTTTLQRRQARLAWMLLIPTLAIVAFIALWPLLQVLYQSLTDARFNSATPTRNIGFQNYQDLFQDSAWWDAVKVSVKFAFVTVVCEFVLGLIVALAVNSSFKGRGLTRAAMLIPWAMITVVSAQMWKFMFAQTSGVVNALLLWAHIISSPQAWLAQDNTSFWALCAVDIWKTTPFVALLLLAGLQVISGDLYEAADVDGASPIQRFVRITLPLLRPAILVTLIFRTLDALRVFDLFWVMTGNNPSTQTMATYNYQNLIPDGDYGYGSAISVAIFLIIALFVVLYVTFLKVETE
jgi:trehalose/maltose transport system permease protein